MVLKAINNLKNQINNNAKNVTKIFILLDSFGIHRLKYKFNTFQNDRKKE